MDWQCVMICGIHVDWIGLCWTAAEEIHHNPFQTDKCMMISHFRIVQVKSSTVDDFRFYLVFPGRFVSSCQFDISC